MKAKPQEHARAIELRKQGMSIKAIASELNVSQASVSTWVRHVKLTIEQRNSLDRHAEACRREGRKKASEVNRKRFAELRRSYRELGKKKARERSLLHSQGCMLYWAEGYKSNNKNTVCFVNSDPNMLRLFVKFLVESLEVDPSVIKYCVHCYDNNGVPVSSIEEYWIDQLSIPKSQLLNTHLKKHVGKVRTKRKLIYGTCVIHVHRVKVYQHIMGAIEEYARMAIGE
jgi:predicted transcriptional regulator